MYLRKPMHACAPLAFKKCWRLPRRMIKYASIVGRSPGSLARQQEKPTVTAATYMLDISNRATESPAPVAVGLRILAGAILGLMVWRADAVESFAESRPRESGTGFYVAVDGQANNAGTADSPWDIESALAGAHTIPPGSTVYLKGGTYRHADRRWESPGFAIALAGTPGQPIHIRPLPGHRVTLDGRVEVKSAARHLRVWELEITVSETATWNRRVTAGGLKVDGPADLPQGGLNILGGADSKFIHLVIHDMNSGIGFWRSAVDAEIHGCLIHGIGSIGPDRYYGPGIYTQNETGTKALTDNILFGNYSTTIQAYGSTRAPVSGFRIEGNIAFAPVKEGNRQRVLIGGGQPSRRIIAADNILYEVPLQLGYNSPYNEDAVVTGNWIVDAGLSINRFKEVTESGNTVIPRGSQHPDRPADIILRPSHTCPVVETWPSSTGRGDPRSMWTSPGSRVRAILLDGECIGLLREAAGCRAL